jgi:hypothetical protein
VKKHLLLLLLASAIIASASQSLKAQTIELLGGNTLNGAMNGVILGGATMALQNSDDLEPARVGLGAGTLFGIGIGVYDLSRTQKGQQFYISGTFNDGTNTSILILLDTIYGAAAGAVVASSVALIVKDPIVDALQYGSGAGAWAGFGFGLIDAFMFAEGPNFAQQNVSLQQSTVNGLLTYTSTSNNVEVGVISPDIVYQKELTQSSLARTLQPSLNLVELSIRL